MTEREIYKGIEFVRISNLPKEQSERIHTSFSKDKIIKILRDEVILRDCIQYHDYQEWFRKSYSSAQPVVSKKTESVRTNSFDLTIK
jgi:hypothetical protein